MSLFTRKEKTVAGLIGVDIGAGGIKVVELVPDKSRLRLATYGYSDKKSPGAGGTPLIDDPKKAAAILVEIIKQAKIKSVNANAALPSQHVFHAVVTIPQPRDAKTDLKPIIESQVKKLLPMPIDEMIIDSMVIDKHLLPVELSKESGASDQGSGNKKDQELKTKGDKHIRVLISGAPKKLVAKYVEIFKLAKLNLTSLETEAFALIRSLVGKDKARIMIVDIGYERTNLSIIDQGIPYLHRSIKAGGADVTKMIAKQMGVSLEQAEQTKLDLAISTSQGEIPPVLQEAMMPILHEIKYALELYAQQSFHDNSSVEKIIITGGSAHLPQIDPFLTKALNINVYIGDPWARIATPEGIKPLINEIGPRFSAATGLAMKLMKEDKK